MAFAQGIAGKTHYSLSWYLAFTFLFTVAKGACAKIDFRTYQECVGAAVSGGCYHFHQRVNSRHFSLC
jgi:hypothetical protein